LLSNNRIGAARANLKVVGYSRSHGAKRALAPNMRAGLSANSVIARGATLLFMTLVIHQARPGRGNEEKSHSTKKGTELSPRTL
jgi:hypothetical protein